MKRYRFAVSLLILALAAANVGAQYALGPAVNVEALNSPFGDGGTTLSKDGLEVYFHSHRPGGQGGIDLWVSRRASPDAEWGPPENLGPKINTEAFEICPSISSDGLELYFCDAFVIRPDGMGGGDLWVVRRASVDAPWGEPENLAAINTPGFEVTPEISPNGRELYFEADWEGGAGDDDIWVARRRSKSGEWQSTEWAGPVINGAGMDHCPGISRNGRVLFYDQNRENSPIGDLVFVTRRTKRSDWRDPVNLGNTESDHFQPSLSADGSMLYFTSDRSGGLGENDIWMAPLIKVKKD